MRNGNEIVYDCFTCLCSRPKATLADTSAFASLGELASEGRAAARMQMSFASWLIK